MAFSGLEGKIALVSGASRGVGRAYALALAQAGAKVIATARTLDGNPNRPGSLAELVATGHAEGHSIAAYECNLRDEASIVRVAQQARANFGGIDILVNNAVWSVRHFDSLAVPMDEWNATMEVNIRGNYIFMREIIPQMTVRGGGSIINITSGSAGVTPRGSGAHDGLVAYGVSKAALDRLTTYFAAELADRNIAVNSVSPGHVARYIASGREPDLVYWGAPIVHLAQQRPGAGLTGQILHTYQFGRSWGPKPATRPRWDEEINAILKEAGLEP